MNPKLRPIDAQWITHEGQQLLLLRERTGLGERGIALPPPLVPLLPLMDGTRDEARLHAAFTLRTGISLPRGTLGQLLEQLDEALMLEGARFDAALAQALVVYRSQPSRPLSVAGAGYPETPDELADLFAGFGDGVEEATDGAAVRGIVCPHIDYRRGGRAYARTWLAAARAVREAEVVVAFGTDHMGAPGALTPTRLPYATPWGVLPLATDVVEAMAEALGEQAAFAEELHHRAEHSLELALNWLHYVRGGEAVEVAPVLCGSFHSFVGGEGEPRSDAAFARALAAVRETTQGRRLLVLAAADLAHVGPAFDDPRGLDGVGRAALKAADEARLGAASSGDAEAFFGVLRDEGDCHKVCGLPPMYLALRLLDGAKGEVVTYQQCPAGQDSVVSVAGIVYK